ncbi:Uncharacterized conserved protein, DUF736 family [Sphingomonas laterariae]|uniref:Uncharacterized conserved protein, DUF736 family n=1 Tax=Edaphosphingomonas laterariae TaxID=861865 RepID=A0A239GHI5_9SPHN|nr:DUF736 domain-containing protein [Sphingomonas laterariae]SNS68345.1 Uncharacterized conserved protein, DUF736 family [Sphingomonas laterariae]
MKIGFFKLDEERDLFIGKIVTRTMRFPYLILRRPEDRGSANPPEFEIFEPTEDGDEAQVGVVWKRPMKDRDEQFLSGMIDDPSFREPLPIALFGDELQGFDVQWRRERERKPQTFAGGGNGYGQRRAGGGQRQTGGGFAGGSTAGSNGEYVGAGRNLDDEVPF